MLPLLNKENETFIPEENISCLNSEVYFSDEKYKCGLEFVFIHTGSKSECLKNFWAQNFTILRNSAYIVP